MHSQFFHQFLLLLIIPLSPQIQANSSTFPQKSSTNPRGQQLYENLKVKIQYNQCWEKAINILHDGCQNMNDYEQRKVAYYFMICHLEASGRKLGVEEDCGAALSSTSIAIEGENEAPNEASNDHDTKNPTLKYCLAILTPNNFQIYTEFFTHVHDLCHHLQQAFWVKSTENTINKLSDQSSTLSNLISDSSKIAFKTLEIQKSIDDYTEKITESNSKYKNSLDELKDWIKSDVVNGLTEDIFKIYNIIHQNSEILNKIVYYFFGSVAVFILTGVNKATKSCRFLCLSSILLCLICEYYFFKGKDNDTKIYLHEIYLLRKFTALLIVLTILYRILTFRNINTLNYEKLTRLEGDLRVLKESLDVIQTNLTQIQEENYKLDPDFGTNAIEYDSDDSSSYDEEISESEVEALILDDDLARLKDVRDRAML